MIDENQRANLAQTMIEHYSNAILEFVRTHPLGEPIFCMAIAYDDSNCDMLPPLIGIGLESERIAYFEEYPDNAGKTWGLWQPSDFAHFSLDLPQTQVTSHLFQQLNDIDCTSEDEDHQWGDFTIYVLRALSSRLMTLDLASVAQLTSDFVVYTVSIDEADADQLEHYFRQAIPVGILNQLESKGYLWFKL